MKKTILILTALCCVHAAISQTLNVVVGEVTYQVPAAQAGDMLYADGATLTIMGKTFKISEIDNMYVDATVVVDNTVGVVYDGGWQCDEESRCRGKRCRCEHCSRQRSGR